MGCLESSIYQDVPLHTLEEFLELAPEELRSQEAENEHQLMLNRLSFELSERQRYKPTLTHQLIILISEQVRSKEKGINSTEGRAR